MKACSHCRELKPLDAFAVDNTRGGHQRLCRVCMAERRRAWRAIAANRATENRQRRDARANHPEAARARDKAEREKHAEARAKQNRQWRQRNSLARSDYERAYREENAEKRRDWEGRRRARKRGAYVETVNALVLLEAHDGVCGICGDDVDPLRFDVDHIVPLARGGEHSYANTQPAHPRCNARKGHRA